VPRPAIPEPTASGYNDRMSEPLADREFSRILIIKPSSLGDIVQALPILEGLRGRYPRAHIAWLVATPLVGLVQGHAALDQVIPFDRTRFGRVGRSLAVTRDFIRFLAGLRRERFDLVIDLQGLFRSGFFAFMTRAAVRIGPGEARELAPLFYTHRYPLESMDIHSITRMWKVADLLGFATSAQVFRLPVTDSDRATVRQLLSDRGLDPAQDYAVVFPAARWETKVWPAERFAAVVDRMATELGLRVVLAGSAAEREACRAVSERSTTRPPILAGDTTLSQVSALIEGARIVLTNDSGPMHMADAIGRPMVAIFGPTNPVRTGPYHQPESVVRVDLPCSPCYLKHLRQCPRGHACMQGLDVERIMAALKAGLGGVHGPESHRTGAFPHRSEGQ
jgi:heptosyltransferase I